MIQLKATSKWALVILNMWREQEFDRNYLERPSVMQTGVCLLFLLWSGGEQERGRPARMCWFLRESRTLRRCSLGSGVRKPHVSAAETASGILRKSTVIKFSMIHVQKQWCMKQSYFGWGPTVMQFSYVLWFNGEVLDRPNNEYQCMYQF